jgi:hypothetical protein
MFYLFRGGHRGGDGGVSADLIRTCCARKGVEGEDTFVSTNLLIVARISWWPETSSSVSGRYFSTLLKVLISARHRETRNVPWQTVFCFDWEVGGASLAFGIGVV